MYSSPILSLPRLLALLVAGVLLLVYSKCEPETWTTSGKVRIGSFVAEQVDIGEVNTLLVRNGIKADMEGSRSYSISVLRSQAREARRLLKAEYGSRISFDEP